MALQPRAHYWAASPPEILSLVASYLPNPAHRAKCVLVSKVWCELWTPLLWRYVILSTPAQGQLFLSVDNRPSLQHHAHFIRLLAAPEALDLGNLLIQSELQGGQSLHALDVEFPIPPLPPRRRRGRREGVVRPPVQPVIEATIEMPETAGEVAAEGTEASATEVETATEVEAATAAEEEDAGTTEPTVTEPLAEPVEAEAAAAAAAAADVAAQEAAENEAEQEAAEEAEVAEEAADAAAQEAVEDSADQEEEEIGTGFVAVLADAIAVVSEAILEATEYIAASTATTTLALVPQTATTTTPLLASSDPSSKHLPLEPLDMIIEWIRRNPGLKHLSLKGDFDDLKFFSSPDYIHPGNNTPTLFHRLESSSLVSLTLDFQQNHSNQRLDLYGNILRSTSNLPLLNGLTHFSIRGFSGNDDLVLAFLERCPNLKDLEVHAWLSRMSFLKKMAGFRVLPSVTSSSSNTSSLSIMSSLPSSSWSSSSSSSSMSPSLSLAPPPWSSMHLQKLESLIWDATREVTDRKLCRLFGAAECAYGWKRLTIPSVSKGFGPLSRDALMKYVTRMESLVVGGIQGFDSPSIQRFLEAAISLKRFEGLNREEDTSRGGCLRAYDLSLEVAHLYDDTEQTDQDMTGQEISTPWACAKTLESLALLITDVPRSDICFQYDGVPWDAEGHAEYWVTDTFVQFWGADTTQELGLLKLEKDMHRRAYTQLGQLKGLQELYLGQTPGTILPEEEESHQEEEDEVVVIDLAVEAPVILVETAEVVLVEDALAEDTPVIPVAIAEVVLVEDASSEAASAVEVAPAAAEVAPAATEVAPAAAEEPAENTSEEEGPAEQAPVENALAVEVPVEVTPAEEAPAVEAPLGETPADEVPEDATATATAETEAEVPPQPQPQEGAVGTPGGMLQALDAWFEAIQERRAAEAASPPFRSRNTMRPFQYGCLKLSLESGLDLMKDLKQLRVLDVSGMAHRIGVQELEWMHVNWPRLKWIEGLLTSPSAWADEAFQTKRKEEVEAWLQKHPWGIGSSYY